MAGAATAMKLHVRLSRLQESSLDLQDKTWVQEAMGDIARRGKFLLDVLSTKSWSHAPAAGAAVVGSSGLLLPQPRPTKAAAILPNDPVESLVANLAAQRDNRSSKLKLQPVQAHAAVTASLGQGVCLIEAELNSTLVQTMEDDEYRWETDPNGGWLGFFT